MNVFILSFTAEDGDWEIDSVHQSNYGALERIAKLKKENCESTDYAIGEFKLL